MIQIDTSNARSFLPENWLTSRLDALESARKKLETCLVNLEELRRTVEALKATLEE